MIILKAQEYSAASDVAKFINVNGIKKEDIIAITTTVIIDSTHHTIFYYADSEKEAITRGLFGW